MASPPDLDPRGRIHIPLGIPDTLDSFKTFVEAEGGFSPGFGTWGFSFWLYDPAEKRLHAPTEDGAQVSHGLTPEGYLIPWTKWTVGTTTLRSELCQVERETPRGPAQVVGWRITVTRPDDAPAMRLYIAMRALGPAGGPLHHLATASAGDALRAESHPALIAITPPDALGVMPDDSAPRMALAGETPTANDATSPTDDASALMSYDLKPGEQVLSFVCPVLPARRAVEHHWDGVSEWAQFDLNAPNPKRGDYLQPDPGLDFYRELDVDDLFTQSRQYWRDFAGQTTVRLPESRWQEADRAITAHVALAMNAGAPDVAVVNYNVFNRDGVYVTHIFQRAGRFEDARRALDYFLRHPFNGRIHPEADNPGQILWALGEQWRYTHDTDWLDEVYPAVQKLAAMITYYRTTPGPHWVNANSLDFGETLPPEQRQELKPGACDGVHPEYTEAFDIAGLRAAALLAVAHGRKADTKEWTALAERLLTAYTARFGDHLADGYGSYCVLWPCRLYPLDKGPAHDAFHSVGPQSPDDWRYFPLARAHQSLLAGNRAAGYQTLERHLDHEQMRGWYAFDEGGPSGVGGWNHALTTWPHGEKSVAMPHGWSVAELVLLLRDSLLFEQGDRLVLLAGVPPDWFRSKEGMSLRSLPTVFGKLTLEYRVTSQGAVMELWGDALPPGGFTLRLPPDLGATVTHEGEPLTVSPDGDCVLPPGTRRLNLTFPAAP